MGQSHGSDLSPEQYEQMVRTSGFSDTEINNFHERFNKDCHRGEVDKKGFKKMYSEMFPQGTGADKLTDNIFRIYDADGTGKISFQEFVATLSISARGSAEEKLMSLFRLYDADRSGFIQQKELTEILTAIHKSRKDSRASSKAKHDAAKIMSELDTDRNKRLSELEFIQAAKGDPEILRIMNGEK